MSLCRHIAFLWAAFALGALPAAAEEPLFSQQIEVDGQTMAKLGEYRYVYRFFFPLYEAALFTAEGGSADSVLGAEKPFQLKFRYLREIDKSIILKSADRMLEKNLSESERTSIAEGVDRINAAYRTVNEGDTSSLTFVPGQGTTLTINGEPQITLPGEDFARLYFTIWLGQNPISGSLKKHLLGFK